MSNHSCSKRYEKMIYNRLGKSGLKISAIAMGMWHNFGRNEDFKLCRTLVCRAFDLGITYFDLANNYGPPIGAAEETFGKILMQDLSGYRDELIITTKAGHRMWEGPYGFGSCKKYLVSSLDQSLKRIGVDYVDIFFSHRFDEDTPLEETLTALDSIVRQGKALYIGVSSGYNFTQMEEVIRILRELGTPCLVHMSRYSMLSREIEGNLQSLLAKERIGSIAFSPLAEGALTNKYIKGIPDDSRAAKGAGNIQKYIDSEERLRKLSHLNAIAAKRGQSLAQMAIAWVLRNGRMQSAIVGASKVSQLEENVAALEKLDFCQEELDSIEQLLNGL